MFEEAKSPIEVGGLKPDYDYFARAFSKADADRYFHELKQEVDWRQEKIRLFGRHVSVPRLTAWYGDEGKNYTYSGIGMAAKPWIPSLLEIKGAVEKLAAISFNSVLLNLYRDGNDSVAWHSDDEAELGDNPIIGSVSFGEVRRFSSRTKPGVEPVSRHELELAHGSCVVMKGRSQSLWQHQVPKTKRPSGARINLTFRRIF